MKEMKKVVFGILMIVCLSIPVFAQSAAELYQQGLVQENGAGNLRNAIQLYERAAKEAKGDRTTAALALMGAARCYEKLGQDESRRLYEEVTRSYADQQEQAALARERLGTNSLAPNFEPAVAEHLIALGKEMTLSYMRSRLEAVILQEAELSQQYAPQHPARVKLSDEIGNLSRALRMAAQESEFERSKGGNLKTRLIPADTELNVSGVVKEVRLINPSIEIVVEVRQTNGALQVYRIKGRSPDGFTRAGYNGLVKAGDTVTVEGLQQADDIQILHTATLTLSDGTKIFLGGSVAGLQD